MVILDNTLHNWEPSIVTWNYENIRSLRVVIWSQECPLSYLVQPLERLELCSVFATIDAFLSSLISGVQVLCFPVH